MFEKLKEWLFGPYKRNPVVKKSDTREMIRVIVWEKSLEMEKAELLDKKTLWAAHSGTEGSKYDKYIALRCKLIDELTDALHSKYSKIN